MSFEPNLILRLQQTLSLPVSRAVVVFLARWLIWFFIPFALLARLNPRLRHAVYEAAWTAALALASSTFLAAIFSRARPYIAVDGVIALVPPNLQSGAFPSSHTAVAFGVAAALAYANVPVGIAAFVMAILVAFGRVAAGMHYPTDVLGGTLIGLLSFAAVRAIHRGLRSVGATYGSPK